MLLYALDLIGTFAFATYGSHRALQRHLDVLGVFVCAGLTATGGGTIREAIMHGGPAYLRDYTYVLCVVLGATVALAVHRNFHRLTSGMLVLDGVGLAAFALIGAARAHQAGYGLVAMTLCAVLTAVGGGILCDLVIRRKPSVLHGDFALVPACLMAVLAYLWRDRLGQQSVVLGLVAAVFAVHMIGLRLSWRVWRPVPEPARPAWDLPTVPLQRLPQAPQPVFERPAPALRKDDPADTLVAGPGGGWMSPR